MQIWQQLAASKVLICTYIISYCICINKSGHDIITSHSYLIILRVDLSQTVLVCLSYKANQKSKIDQFVQFFMVTRTVLLSKRLFISTFMHVFFTKTWNCETTWGFNIFVYHKTYYLIMECLINVNTFTYIINRSVNFFREEYIININKLWLN